MLNYFDLYKIKKFESATGNPAVFVGRTKCISRYYFRNFRHLKIKTESPKNSEKLSN